MKGMSRPFLAALLLLLWLPGGCRAPSTPESPAVDLVRVLSSLQAPPGWEISEQASVYTEENLYNLVNGQAESFFAYGFEQVAVQRYQNGETQINLEIWQLAAPAGAYGLFTAGGGSQNAEIGNAGSARPGWRLAFWQEAYFTSIGSSREVSDETLWSLGRAISAALPQGGEIPAVVSRLPGEGLVSGSQLFFHEAISVQMEVWLGDDNALGLTQATHGALARYEVGGQTVRLMVVEYPGEAGAQKGLQALQSGAVEDVLAADAKGNRLAAVFGNPGPEAQRVQDLVSQALE